jgi:nucleotide-binding universal stress UspA family protein
VDNDLEQATAWAQQAVEYLRLHNIRASELAAQGRSSMGSTILDYVAQTSTRLLVMGRSTLREFLCGSVTDTVIRSSPVPVLLCH